MCSLNVFSMSSYKRGDKKPKLGAYILVDFKKTN